MNLGIGGRLRNPVLVAWFVVLWCALWGSFTLANLAAGLAVALGVVLVAPLPRTGQERFGHLPIRPWKAFVFLAYFGVKLVQSNLQLAWEVVTPRNTISPGILAIDLRDCSDAVITLIANAITLTPGTLTIEVRRRPTTIYVHVLHLNDPDAVRADLYHLARLAIAAFGSPQALAQFDPQEAAA